MRKLLVSSQGWEFSINAPETVEEYNGLAPKRLNPCLEDAIFNTWYRNGAPRFRDALCTYLEGVTGVARINSGTEEKPEWEKEGAFRKRAIATALQAAGKDPNLKANQDAFVAEHQVAIQGLADAIAFDPSEREATGGSPTIAKTYTAWATMGVDKDGGKELAGLLGTCLGRTITLTGTREMDILVLAKAIAENEKRKRDAMAATGYIC